MNVQPSRAFVPGVAPPQRVDLGDIVARRWQPDNLIARCEAVTMSYPAPHQWMARASEPITLDQQRAYGETCDEANVRSAAVPRRPGYRLDRVEPRPARAPAESGLLMVWTKSSTAETVR
jgi:hypothetical protein